jgi:hypothetical protein
MLYYGYPYVELQSADVVQFYKTLLVFEGSKYKIVEIERQTNKTKTEEYISKVDIDKMLLKEDNGIHPYTKMLIR